MLQTLGYVHLLHQRLPWLLFQVYLCLWSPFLAFNLLPGRLPFHRRRAPRRLCVSMHRQVCPRVLDQVQFHNPATCHQMYFKMYCSSSLPGIHLQHRRHTSLLDIGSRLRQYHQAILAADMATTTQPTRYEVLVKLWQQASTSSLRVRTIPGKLQ